MTMNDDMSVRADRVTCDFSSQNSKLSCFNLIAGKANR
jgi:hypothetical protein